MATEWKEQAEQCIEASRRAAAWLRQQQLADGAWKGLEAPPVDAYYKVGCAFNLAGEGVAAERTFNYVRRHFLQSDGDFAPRAGAWHREVHYQYANGWLVIGAQKQGRYDIAVPALRFLLTQQDIRHGGFYSLRAEAGQVQRSDTMSSGIAGVACLAAGQLETARRVAKYYERLIALQPAPQERFFTTLDADGTLVTQFPDDQAKWRVVETKKEDQCWYAVGLPFAFAVLLSQATGEKRCADLAQWFFDFQMRCVNPWDGGSSGKAGWGCSMLYRMTGHARYRAIALHIADNIMANQLPTGRIVWGGLSGYGVNETVLSNRDFDITAEFSIWLGLIGMNLLAGE